MDSLTLAISQGSLRRGSAACYLDIHHPEIEEFLEIRKPGAISTARRLNLHHGICITDEFMEAVRDGAEFDLRSAQGRRCAARWMRARCSRSWSKLRLATGEPYIVFSDTVNNAMPKHHRDLGLKVRPVEPVLGNHPATGRDHNWRRPHGGVLPLLAQPRERGTSGTATSLFIEDVLRFLDNVLQDFIDRAPPKWPAPSTPPCASARSAWA
jgi:ribonucleoside-diphosphate reductase alpha chain